MPLNVGRGYGLDGLPSTLKSTGGSGSHGHRVIPHSAEAVALLPEVLPELGKQGFELRIRFLGHGRISLGWEPKDRNPQIMRSINGQKTARPTRGGTFELRITASCS